ncbi:Polynucleotide 5'-hydroxyl-kinase grc3 [Lithohypha guttulata]|uniref:Polynucleotide 5'-hydroxyl-kinase grc3 n=1 Tax=Lithohypha guttulata TaxID=1690604 RepID=UPI002DE176AC|nr:hypothetical protein LTR51_003503 [Lithohypha guttulata]
MSSETRVSAFAKRRRLNDGSGALSADSSASIPAKPAKKLKKEKIVDNELQPALSVSDITNDENLVSGTTEESSNSFEPLVEARAVKFTGSREIEQLDGNAFKFRLSRGQKCSISGIARLWVRDGCVTCYGAHIHASEAVHTLFAAVSDKLVDIEPTTKIAEFQLEAISQSDLAFPSPLNIPGKVGREARAGPTSFRIVDADTAGPPRTQQHEAMRALLLAALGEGDTRTRRGTAEGQFTSREPHRIIVCGKRSSDTTLASIICINSLLSEIAQADHSKGVTFLDLDAAAPAFSSPGTISLCTFHNFVLGPSYAFPTQVHKDAVKDLIAAYFVGAVHQEINFDTILRMVNELLNQNRRNRDQPLVVRLGEWLTSVGKYKLTQLKKVLQSNLVLCTDRPKSSRYHDVVSAVSSPELDNVVYMDQATYTTSSSLLEHRNLLQSHVQLCQYVNGTPLWDPHATMLASFKHISLSTSNGPNSISFVIVRGGMLRPQDLFEALSGALVTLVAVTRREGRGSASSNLIICDFSDDLELVHIGVAIVDRTDEMKQEILVAGSVTGAQIEAASDKGLEIGLVLEKSGVDGRYSRELALG